jgi:ABC-type cobalamin/Fe3+-siderophores transport system ATPase subunit
MKLTLTTEFKSLEPFAIDLPDFVILTGINGAGKTQLLTAILNNQLRISDFVKVLGNGSRYSIENYIFDPILVAALLLREKIISREDLELSNNQTYSDFKHLSQSQLQKISDFSVNKILSQFNFNDKSTVKNKLLNEIEIEIPLWYLHCQGHELEQMFVKVFPKLNEIKKGKEVLLKMAIIEKVIDDIPELISVDLLDIYSKLQITI